MIGDEVIFYKLLDKLNLKIDLIPWEGKVKKDKVFYINSGIIKDSDFPQGKDDPLTGKASYEYLRKAWQLLENKKGDCLVTAPISKKAWNMAGIPFNGHTEALSFFSKEKTYMLMVAKNIRVLLSTVHVPLRRIWHILDQDHLFHSAKITAEYVEKFFGIKNIRIGFCGLNPHAGESGTLGKEEEEIIIPVIEKFKDSGINASGPYPADAIFKLAIEKNEFDLIVSMYHDQALPVLKTLFFEKLVNITVNSSGWIRTSPGHGTGFDIAGKNKANPSSMKQAILTAINLARRKRWIHL